MEKQEWKADRVKPSKNLQIKACASGSINNHQPSSSDGPQVFNQERFTLGNRNDAVRRSETNETQPIPMPIATSTFIGEMKQATKCEQNKKCELIRFCTVCKQLICLKDEAHRFHQIMTIEELCQQNEEKISDHIRSIRKLKDNVLSSIQTISMRIDAANQAKAQITREIFSSAAINNEELETERNDKVLIMQTQMDKLVEEHNNISSTLNMIEPELTSRTSLRDLREFIMNQLNKIRKCEEFFEQAHPIFDLSQVCVHDFEIHMVSPYDSSIFEIRDFSHFRRIQSGGFIDELAPLNVNGLSWKLLLYPNGYNEGQNQFLSVFLSVTGLTQPSIFECRLEMLHKSKDVNKIFPRKFVETFKNGERIGFPKFYPLVYLEPNGFLSQDILELRFQVRTPAIRKLFRDQRSIIKKP